MARQGKNRRPAGMAEERMDYVAGPGKVAGAIPGDHEGRNDIPVTPARYRRFRLRMEPNGRIVIPAELRALWNLSDGGELFARFRNGELVLTTPLNGVRLAQAIMAPFKKPGVDEVEAFLKDRPAMWGEADA
jgi:bifunctional DNA-binding transcriptional regulator/antitoxin component of YhaV-PrlF toxin-antitoxin module